MIARTWTGTVRRADADEYAEYSSATGFAEYGQTPGAAVASGRSAAW